MVRVNKTEIADIPFALFVAKRRSIIRSYLIPKKVARAKSPKDFIFTGLLSENIPLSSKLSILQLRVFFHCHQHCKKWGSRTYLPRKKLRDRQNFRDKELLPEKGFGERLIPSVFSAYAVIPIVFSA